MERRQETPRPDGQPVINSIFDALSDSRRRAVVRWLMNHPERSADVETLAARLSALEANADDAADGTTAVSASLHHVHLPKLADANIVAYDASAKTVRYRGRPVVETLLDAAAEREDAPRFD